jgi:hypothetical protein
LKQVFYIIKDRFLPHNLYFDNHVLPQHEFVAGIPRDKLHIVHLENIKGDMHALGYADFDMDLCKSYHIKEYHEFFSKEISERQAQGNAFKTILRIGTGWMQMRYRNHYDVEWFMAHRRAAEPGIDVRDGVYHHGQEWLGKTKITLVMLARVSGKPHR